MKKFGMLMTVDNAQKCFDEVKTVTRRLMNPQPIECPSPVPNYNDTKPGDIFLCPDYLPTSDNPGRVFVECESRGVYHHMGSIPFAEKHARYRVGDIVAIKETHWRWGKYVINKKHNRSFAPVERSSGPDIIFHELPFEQRSCFRGSIGIFDYHKRPNLFMPFDYARTHWEITGVRPERLQDITAADAKAEGVTFEAIRAILAPHAADADVRDHHWIHGGADGSESYCEQCIDAAVAKQKKKFPEAERDGGWQQESEGVQCCETCGVLVDYTLLEYGIESELDHFEAYDFDYKDPQVAHELTCIFDNVGYEKERPDLIDRAYRVGFHILWDSINPDHPWVDNDWVWRYAGKKVTP